MHFNFKNFCTTVLRCVRKCIAEGSNCLFELFSEGKCSYKPAYNCERHRVNGTSTRMINLVFIWAKLPATLCSSGSLDSLLAMENV